MDDDILEHNNLIKKYYHETGNLVRLVEGQKPKINSLIIKKFKDSYPEVEVLDIKSIFWEGYNQALNKIVSEDSVDAFNRGYNSAYFDLNSMEEEEDFYDDEDSLDVDEINAEMDRIQEEEIMGCNYGSQEDYETGFNDGYSEGYDKGYYEGLRNAPDDGDAYKEGYDDGYKDGYEQGQDSRARYEDSPINGYYGADGGFHEYS